MQCSAAVDCPEVPSSKSGVYGEVLNRWQDGKEGGGEDGQKAGAGSVCDVFTVNLFTQRRQYSQTVHPESVDGMKWRDRRQGRVES